MLLQKRKKVKIVFEVEEVTSVEGYRNWVPKKKGFLTVLPKSDFICLPAEVSAHRKVKLQSKPVMEDTIQQFEELCKCFPEVFSQNSEDIGRTSLITMDIDTGDHPPPPMCQKPYTLALKHYEWVQKEVDQLEWMGIITRSVSPWANPIVIVPKKSAPDDGKWEFNMVPFGLAQAPAYFQSLISEVLKGLSHFAIAYLDDITIFSQTEEEHLKHLEIIFRRLKEAELKLKRSKCSLMKLHIEYLGHLISEKGIEPMPDKFTAIKEMLAPRSPKEIKQFLGLVSYYRKFIPRFSDIAKLLM